MTGISVEFLDRRYEARGDETGGVFTRDLSCNVPSDTKISKSKERERRRRYLAVFMLFFVFATFFSFFFIPSSLHAARIHRGMRRVLCNIVCVAKKIKKIPYNGLKKMKKMRERKRERLIKVGVENKTRMREK